MKAAFLSSSLIASKGKAAPASPRLTPKNLLDDDKKDGNSHVSRIYDRVREYAEPHNTEPEQEASDTPEQDISDTITETPEFDSDDSVPAFMTRETATPKKAVTDSNGTPSYQQANISRPSTNGVSSRREITPIGDEKVQEIAAEVSKLKKDGLGRIRISVRMTPKDHLQLKLIAAHTQMSAQSIFETALEEYVANHGTAILPQSCNCVLDKSSL
ncbi:hypothetical protein [Sneathiella sp. HT1-7]|uniref:hypothetical protein n=1 Tax=Sneathiella sp. HT1-7 TaxID=2887192 RepID=UPI001D14889B|nr:hypothetical protein [Sneathiella sp. HT1-7]MCC3305029.1 hypothetical protein [Sneathiella sp. HT1-7]